MSDYHDCDSRDDCDAAREERDELKAENERLRAALDAEYRAGFEDCLSGRMDRYAALNLQQK